MSTDIQICYVDVVTATSTTQKNRVGLRRFENGREYVYMQADDAVTAGQAVMLDAAASSSGLKVTPCAAAGDSCFGIAEVAIADESYGWITVRGVASALVADGTAADDPLGASGASGVLANVVEQGSGTGAYRFVRATALAANASGAAAARNIYLL